MPHPLESRYRAVWEATRTNKQLSAEGVARSRFFFEFGAAHCETPVPKRFHTCAIVCGLPFPASVQRAFEDVWQRCLAVLDHPLSYGVEPANRHTEVFLLQEPHERFASQAMAAAVQATVRAAQTTRAFRVAYRFPFMTPDGTIVVPGFDAPYGTVDALRSRLKASAIPCPEKQSQWFHVSLGRILDPIRETRLKPLLDLTESHWGEVITEVTIGELLWIWEKQWYMVDREVLSRIQLE